MAAPAPTPPTGIDRERSTSARDELLSDLAALFPDNDGDLRETATRLRTEELNIICDRRDRRLSRDLT